MRVFLHQKKSKMHKSRNYMAVYLIAVVKQYPFLGVISLSKNVAKMKIVNSISVKIITGILVGNTLNLYTVLGNMKF